MIFHKRILGDLKEDKKRPIYRKLRCSRRGRSKTARWSGSARKNRCEAFRLRESARRNATQIEILAARIMKLYRVLQVEVIFESILSKQIGEFCN